MKFFQYILLSFVLLSCEEQLPKNNGNNNEVYSIDSKNYSPPTLIQFPDYVITTKDTIYNTWEEGGESEKIYLGKYESESYTFQVITEFSLIPVAEGLKGKSRLYLVDNESDTLFYEADDRSYLPVDVYLNHFVFKNEMEQYVFVNIVNIEEDILCFSYGWDKCLIN